MESTKPTERPSPKPFEKKLAEHDRLRRDNAQNNHRRIGLLIDVFNDGEFRARYGNVDDFKAAEILDERVGDLGFNFLQLKAMYERFPTPVDWENTLLINMHERVLDDHSRPEEEQSSRKKRRLITQAQYKELAAERDQLAKSVEELQHFKGETEMLRDQLERANQRILEVERQNAELRRQLREHEDLVAA